MDTKAIDQIRLGKLMHFIAQPRDLIDALILEFNALFHLKGPA